MSIELQDTAIQIQQINNIKPLQQNDNAIMEIAEEYTNSTTKLEQINAYQMWLQITVISEMFHVNSKHINPNTIYGNHQHDKLLSWQISKSKLMWPNIPCPGNQAWNNWKQFFMHQCNLETLWLKTQLGQWHPNHTQYRTWSWIITKHNIYKKWQPIC